MATKEFNRLNSTALSLPSRQRAKLAETLWDSVRSENEADPPDNRTREELKRRDAEITSGKVRCKTHAEVMKLARKAVGC